MYLCSSWVQAGYGVCAGVGQEELYDPLLNCLGALSAEVGASHLKR